MLLTVPMFFISACSNFPFLEIISVAAVRLQVAEPHESSCFGAEPSRHMASRSDRLKVGHELTNSDSESAQPQLLFPVWKSFCCAVATSAIPPPRAARPF